MRVRDLYDRTEEVQEFIAKLRSYGIDEESVERIISQLIVKAHESGVLAYQFYLKTTEDTRDYRLEIEVDTDEILRRAELGFKAVGILLDDKVRNLKTLVKVKEKLMSEGYSEKEAEEIIETSFKDERIFWLLSLGFVYDWNMMVFLKQEGYTNLSRFINDYEGKVQMLMETGLSRFEATEEIKYLASEVFKERFSDRGIMEAISLAKQTNLKSPSVAYMIYRKHRELVKDFHELKARYQELGFSEAVTEWIAYIDNKPGLTLKGSLFQMLKEQPESLYQLQRQPTILKISKLKGISQTYSTHKISQKDINLPKP